MIIFILLIFGLCLGSFVNAFTYRFYVNNKEIFSKISNKPRKTKTNQKLSIWNGRSICTNCKHQLNAKDLVPVFSWLFLKGKCRYCNYKISAQYPLVELVTVLLFLLSYIYWPSPIFHFQVVLFIFWCLFLVGFMTLIVFDLRWYILPDKIVFGLYYLFIIQFILTIIVNHIDIRKIFGVIIGGLFISSFFWIIYQISDGKWIGGGDVKLGLLLGALSGGFLEALLTVFIASLLGTSVGGLILLISKRFKLKSQIPFGPYLIIATIIVLLFGSKLLDLYSNIVGI